MTTNFRGAFAAVAMLLSCSAGAFAADLYNGGGLKDDGYTPVNNGRPALFYARGDFSLSSNNFDTITEAPNFTESNAHIGNSHYWGGGLGMYFTPHLRGDLTLDYSNHAGVSGDVLNGVSTVTGTREFSVRHLVGLANVYYDFGDRGSRFNPYVGVGLGFARNTTGDGDVAVGGCGAAACSVSIPGASKTNAAGALMAGFTTKLSDRFTFDAGYRFLYTGDAHTGDLQIANAVAPAPSSAPGVVVRDMYEHELRVGLRMDLR